MIIEKITAKNHNLAHVTGTEKIITDAQSALDLALSAKHEADTNKIIIDKKIITPDFFILSTGIAGEILQKYVNYNIKAAIYGDYSMYKSIPLKNFIYESNKGKDIFFVSSKEEAIKKLENI